MSDDAARRQRRQFEPPPWEREGVEPLASKQEPDEVPAGQGETGPDGAAKREPEVDDRKVAAMLIELSGEEGSAKRVVVQAGRTTAKVLVTIGVVMMVVAAVLAVRTLLASEPVSPQAGVPAAAAAQAADVASARTLEGGVGAAVIAVLGAFVAGFAGWMWVRANREQGS
jgi:hypothetical protein